MLSNYQCLIELWDREYQIRQKKREILNWKKKIEARSTDIQKLRHEQEELTQKNQKIHREMESLDYSCNKIQEKIARTELAYAQGIVVDDDLYHQQIIQMKENQESFELEYLECLEEYDKNRERQGIIKQRLLVEEKRLLLDKKKWNQATPSLKADIIVLRQEQEQFYSMMNPAILSKFQHLAKTHPMVLSKIRDKSCSHCNIQVPVQMLSDVIERQLVHNCPNCGSFLVIASARLP